MNRRTLSYEEASRRLAEKTDEELVDVLDGPSRVLCQTAAHLLRRRRRFDLVVGALKERKLTTRDGKVSALNLLLGRGRGLPEAFPIYLQYAGDRSAGAVSCALLGLVLWQDDSVVPLLESLPASTHSELIRKAIDALKCHDPKRFSSGDFDYLGQWKKPGTKFFPNPGALLAGLFRSRLTKNG